MTLTTQQKNIINPYPQEISSPDRAGTTEYYEVPRNKFIIDMIHDQFMNFSSFPDAEKPLVSNPTIASNPTVTPEDLKAYLALYPQNGKFKNKKVIALSTAEINGQLGRVVELVEQHGMIANYLTATTAAAQTSEYEILADQPELTMKQKIGRLVAIERSFSTSYVKSLRAANGLPNQSFNASSDPFAVENPMLTPYIGQQSNVDLYDWRKNCTPGSDSQNVYYNAIDKNYYFTYRTSNRTPEAYDIQKFMDGDEVVSERITSAIDKGIGEILKYSGKFSSLHHEQLIENSLGNTRFFLYGKEGNDWVPIPPGDRRINFACNLDSRPGSQWTLVVYLAAEEIDRLPSSGTVSYKEFDLRPKEIALRLIENSNIVPRARAPYVISFLERYLLATRLLLRKYNDVLGDQEITPEMMNNINLGEEINNLESFFDYLAVFFNYNAISIQDEDIVEFVFSKTYRLLYTCVNGYLRVRGIGNHYFLSEPAAEDERQQVLNAFALMNPTSFCYLFNSLNIYNDFQQSGGELSEDWSSFLPKYTYPQLQISAIQQKFDQAQKIKKSHLLKRKNIFEKVSEIANVSPSEFNDLFTRRDATFKAKRALQIASSIDCDTGQAQVARYALKFFEAMTGKTKVKSLIRETILLLRNEVMQDVFRSAKIEFDGRIYGIEEAAEQGMEWGENPTEIRRDLEKWVNNQINCSLGVFGDFIQNAYLDPIGVPSDITSAIRTPTDMPLKIEFGKSKPLSIHAAQQDVYEKIITTLITNFIKSLVAGIVRDLLAALLGCGPDDKNDALGTGLTGSFKSESYGIVKFPELFENEDVDILEVAKAVKIMQLDTETRQFRTPQRSKLYFFLNDISQVVTAVEAQQLLSGEADNQVLEFIQELIVYNRPLPTPNNLGGKIDPRQYRQLTLDKKKVKEYFIALGEALGPADTSWVANADGKLSFESALQAYCDTIDPKTIPLEGINLSNKQIQYQLDDAARRKLAKINGLCDWLRDMLNFQTELQGFIDALPGMGLYDDALEALSDLSNSLADSVVDFWQWLFGEDDPPDDNPTKRNLYATPMGMQLFWQIQHKLSDFPIAKVILAEEIENPERSTEFGEGGPRHQISQEGASAPMTGLVYQTPHASAGYFRYIDRGEMDPHYAYTANKDAVSYWRALVPGLSWTLDVPPPYGLEYARRVPFPEMRSQLKYDDEHTLDRTILQHYRDDTKFTNPYIGWTGDCYLEWRGNNIKIYHKEIKLKTPHFTTEGDLLEGPIADRTPDPMDIAKYSETPECFNELVADFTPYDNAGLEGEGEPFGPILSYKIMDRNQRFDRDVFNGTMTKWSDQQRSENPEERAFVPMTPAVGGVIVGNDPARQDLIRAAMNSIISSDYFRGKFWRQGMDEPEVDEALAAPKVDFSSIGNTFVTIAGSVNRSFTSPSGKRRLSGFFRGLQKAPFKPVDDVCVTAQEVQIASLTINSIQSRIYEYLVNVSPLITVYIPWNNYGTTGIVIDYLTRKISEDLTDKGLLGVVYDQFPIIKKVYADNPDNNLTFYEPHHPLNPGLPPPPWPYDRSSPENNLKSLIQSVYLKMLDNIAEASEHDRVNTSLYQDDNEIYERYKRALRQFFERFVETMDPDDPALEELTNYMEDAIYADGNAVTDAGVVLGNYYFPVALLYGLYLVWYDVSLKLSQRYSALYLQINGMIEAADNGLLGTVGGTTSIVYNAPALELPTVVNTFQGGYLDDRWAETPGDRAPPFRVWRAPWIRYYNRKSIYDRIAYLEKHETEITDWLASVLTPYNALIADIRQQLAQRKSLEEQLIAQAERVDDLMSSFFFLDGNGNEQPAPLNFQIWKNMWTNARENRLSNNYIRAQADSDLEGRPPFGVPTPSISAWWFDAAGDGAALLQPEETKDRIKTIVLMVNGPEGVEDPPVSIRALELAWFAAMSEMDSNQYVRYSEDPRTRGYPATLIGTGAASAEEVLAALEEDIFKKRTQTEARFTTELNTLKGLVTRS